MSQISYNVPSVSLISYNVPRVSLISYNISLMWRICLTSFNIQGLPNFLLIDPSFHQCNMNISQPMRIKWEILTENALLSFSSIYSMKIIFIPPWKLQFCLSRLSSEEKLWYWEWQRSLSHFCSVPRAIQFLSHLHTIC